MGARVAAPLLIVLAACAGSTPAAPPAAAVAEDWRTGLDHEVLAQLTRTVEAGPLIFHVRPGDLPEETLVEDIAANVAYFEELQRLLAMHYEGQVHVFLYRDGEDMLATTRSGSNIAFSTGTRSIHQVHDFRGVHELTHIFALQFPRNPDGSTDLFATEGLATAMAGSDQNVPVHAWAAMYLRLDRLPDLTDLRGDFMERAGAGVHPYHVAASFVQRLVELYGIEAVKRWYVNCTEAGLVFGVSFPRLEADWRDHLAALPVEPAHEAHVLAQFGRSNEPLPAAWRTAPGTVLFAGGALDALQPDDASRWTLRDGLLVGSHDGPWTAIHSRASFGPDVGLRVRFRLVSGDAVQLRLDRAGDAEGQAIFARWSSYMSVGDDHIGNDTVKIPTGEWCDAVFVDTGGRGRLYLNGWPVLDKADALPCQPGLVGLAVERGVVEVAEIVAFVP
jgi:hypothetical protein